MNEIQINHKITMRLYIVHRLSGIALRSRSNIFTRYVKVAMKN